MLFAVLPSARAQSSSTEELACLLREYTFEAVLSDRRGHKCRGNITTNACYGWCDTCEIGSDISTDGNAPCVQQQVCGPDRTETKNVPLTTCDDDADQHIRRFIFIEALSCVCQKCDPTKMKCSRRTQKVDGETRKRTYGVHRRLVGRHPNPSTKAAEAGQRQKLNGRSSFLKLINRQRPTVGSEGRKRMEDVDVDFF